ncbi:MAG TPA: YbaB/EbfC family nucleoid-associated protein [Pseudonocardiaceae bacterium]|nr:YbaB/EbfC family nucleoid-associated protein [Pseudonocardiaceae bacterium]
MDVAPGDYLQQLVNDMAAESAEARRMVAIRARAEKLTFTQQSPDGTVRVTVNRAGAVIDLAFADSAGRLDPRRLSGTVMGAIRQAKAGIAAQYERIVRESGVAEATADRLIGRFRSAQPHPVAPQAAQPWPQPTPPPIVPPPPAPQRPARPAPQEAEDDFGDTFTVLQRGYRKP